MQWISTDTVLLFMAGGACDWQKEGINWWSTTKHYSLLYWFGSTATAYSLYLGLSRAESSNSDIDRNLNHFCLSLLNPRAFYVSSVAQKSYVLLSHFENSSQSHPKAPFSFCSFFFFHNIWNQQNCTIDTSIKILKKKK